MVVQFCEYIKNHWIVNLKTYGAYIKSHSQQAIVLFQVGQQTHKCNSRYWQTASDLHTSSQNSHRTDEEMWTAKVLNYKGHLPCFVCMPGTSDSKISISLYGKATTHVPLLVCVFEVLFKRLRLTCEPATLCHLISRGWECSWSDLALPNSVPNSLFM